MLQHDYIVDLIRDFCDVVVRALRQALLFHDLSSTQDVEAAVGQVLDLDAECALALSPESLVTMMQLSGVGESVASYVAYALDHVGDAYDAESDPAGPVRHAQAKAIATAFNCPAGEVPEEFEGLERELDEAKGN